MFDAVKTKDNIINWIKDYFNKNGKDCNAVIGLSGGKDSSIAAALCVQALGKDRVIGILMPQGEQHDIDYSKDLAVHLGIKYYIVNIKDSVDTLLASINQDGLSLNKQAVTNIPARIRMTTLYAVSAALNGRVVNTCNLSEDWVGYSTKYGDSAGDFSPLSQFTVTEIKQIAKALALPDKFINKVPEDGLSGLTDEANLGFSYEVLDRYIREGICTDPALKEEIDRLHRINKHKLELMPSFCP
ncbi:MAG: NAD(+) synthase [Treponema sp.]|jgi:NAD+ synthase|nr:NAD(+) synthase [Treponema sp.]